MNTSLKEFVNAWQFGADSAYLAALPDGRRTINVATSDVAVNKARIRSGIKRVNDIVTYAKIEISMSAGYVILELINGETKWFACPSFNSRWKPGQEANPFETFTPVLLDALDDVYTEIQWQHFAVRSLTTMANDELRTIENSVPEFFSLPHHVQEKFGEFILHWAHVIELVREKERNYAYEVAISARLTKQFNRVPAGTILVSRADADSIAIVSDRTGIRTKRSLSIYRSGQQERQVDMKKIWRKSYCFMTPQKAAQLDPGLLSRHKVLLALRQAERLIPEFPDIAADAWASALLRPNQQNTSGVYKYFR